MPEIAAGTTTFTVTSSFVAPRAYAASRSERGTDRNTSSLSDTTIGRIMNPTTMLALAALNTPAEGKPLANPRRDRDDGQIAKHDRRNAGQHFQHRLHDFAHRVRRVLAQIDRRHQTRSAARRRPRPAVTSSVPQSSGRMPNCCGSSFGDHSVPVRNSPYRHFAEELRPLRPPAPPRCRRSSESR